MHKHTQPQHKSRRARTHIWHWKHVRTTHICKHLHLSHIAGAQSRRCPGNTMSLSCWKQISFSPEVSLYHNRRFGGCLGTALSTTVLIAILGQKVTAGNSAECHLPNCLKMFSIFCSVLVKIEAIKSVFLDTKSIKCRWPEQDGGPWYLGYFGLIWEDAMSATCFMPY